MRKATELEIIAHAKGYLDKLANGINPLTNEALEEHEIVNNVRISRCLFFVSDVLRQVIEKGCLQGLKSSRSVYTEPFHLTQEQRARFPYSKSPMYISAIAKQLNELAGSSEMKPLSHAAISGFMEWPGYLCQPAAAAGQPKRVPTESRQALGIRTERRVNQHGVPYQATLYSESAQRFIVAHLDEIEQLNRLSRAERAQLFREAVNPETGEILRPAPQAAPDEGTPEL